MAQAFKSIVMLAVLLAIAAAIAGAVAAAKFGPAAYMASFLAAGLVFAAGAIALSLTGLPATGPGRVNGALASLLVRTGLLLAALIAFSRMQHPLVEAGLVGLFLLHYFIGLAAETLLSVRLIRVASAGKPVAAASATTA